MLAEYHALKRSADLPSEPMLKLFESYCDWAAPAMDAMEWSWKLQGWKSLANRVFWLGSSREPELTRRCLDRLVAELGFRADTVEGGRAAWNDIVAHHLDRALVAYAGSNPFTGRGPVIKIYLVLTACGPDLYRRVIQPVSPLLPDACPDGIVVLFCQTLDERGESSSRVYTLFNREDCRRCATADFIIGVAGERALDVAEQYPRSGLGLKHDGTDMLGIGLRPTGRRRLDFDDLMTPVVVPLTNAAARIPELESRVERVTWVTVPLDDESLGFPRKIREMNVYVRLC